MHIIGVIISLVLLLCWLFPSVMLPIIIVVLFLIWEFGPQLVLGVFLFLFLFTFVMLIIKSIESSKAKSKAEAEAISDDIEQKKARELKLKQQESDFFKLKLEEKAEAKARSDEEKRRYSEAVKLKRQQFKEKILKQQEEYKASQLLKEAEDIRLRLREGRSQLEKGFDVIRKKDEEIKLKRETKRAKDVVAKEKELNENDKELRLQWLRTNLIGKVSSSLNTPAEIAKEYRLHIYQVFRELKKLGIEVGSHVPLEEQYALELCYIFEARREELKYKPKLNALDDLNYNSKQLEQKYVDRKNKLKNVIIKETSQELKKICLVLDLCENLLPSSLAKKIISECIRKNSIKKEIITPYLELNQKSFSYFFVSYFNDVCVNDNFALLNGSEFDYFLRDENKTYQLYTPRFVVISDAIKNDYNLIDSNITSPEELNKCLITHIKNSNYTGAILEFICFINTGSFIKKIISKSNSVSEILPVICNIFIEIGAIETALKLYDIDQSVFNSPNRLSNLASKAIQNGLVDKSNELLQKLIDREPYHPSIAILQAEIKNIEQRNQLKSTCLIDFSKIEELSGIEFENLLKDKFSAMGFKVESTPKTGDFGADLIVENIEGTRFIVQCKRFKSKVNLKAVQEVLGAIGHYAGDLGIVITNNTFLNSAIKLAESHDIELWDGNKLVSFLAGDLSFSKLFTMTESSNVIKQ